MNLLKKISESNDSELSGTDENSNTDFSDLVLDGDASDLGGGAFVTDADVVWEGGANYIANQ
jgi:hypothetical protein